MIEGETMRDENKKIARLIKQIQRGNQSAFEEFYKLTSHKAYFIALKITQNEHDAEDILQESYIKSLEKIGEIDTSQNITSWFLKIVANKSKDLLKSRNRLVFDGDEDVFFDEIPEEKTEFCPEENLDQEELRLEVMAAIDELTEEKRACIMMMYFGDMSIKEIAESIEVPESTVKNRLYTARKDLRTKFEKNGNILYGAALGGVLIWALNKTSVTASAAFLASAASAEIVTSTTAAYSAGATATTVASTVATSTAASTAASTGTSIAAKIAVASVAQKIAIGVAATAVIGGSTAGVVTVVKNTTAEEPTTQITESVTTAPTFTTEYVFNEITLPETTTDTDFSAEKETVKNSTRASTKRTSTTEHTTVPASITKAVTKKETTTKVKTTTTTKPTTTRKETTTQTTSTTTRAVITTQEETTTHKAATTQKVTTTTKPVTTTQVSTTAKPTTAEPTTQAKATVSIDIIDLDGSVIDTINIEVEAGTTLSKEYIVTVVQAKGYEPMAGVYGDIGSVAQGGNTYKFEAEL